MLTKSTVFLALILNSYSCFASIITETWLSTVTSAGSSALVVADSYKWSVTYDDASLRMSLYNDGVNEIAEQGSGDDITYATQCVDPQESLLGCDQLYTGYIMFSDATFSGLDVLFNDALPSGHVDYDDTPFSFSRWYQDDLSRYVGGFILDGTSFQFIHGGFSRAALASMNSNTGDVLRSSMEFSNVIQSRLTATIPEPAVILLFFTGLLGLRQFKQGHKASDYM